jgi:RecJ-like exonuclease
MELNSFFYKVREFADELYESFKESHVRVISHIDADGLSSAGIFISILKKFKVPFHLSSVKYLNESLVDSLKREPYELCVFLDLGSGEVELLKSIGKRVFVIDHHRPSSGDIPMLNPFIYGIDGDRDVSSSGLCFLLYREFFKDYSMVPVALAGALGDLQEEGGFSGLNETILNWGIERGIIEVRKEIKLFGGPDYPLVSSLERTVEPFIRGVSDDSAGALSLIESLGIPIKIGEKWVTLSDLSEDQKRDLLNELVKRVESLDKAKSLLGNTYVNLMEPKGSPLRDLSSFSTLLNACGRMGRGYLGVLLAAGMRGEILSSALSVQQEYKKHLSSLLRDLKPRVVGKVAFIDEGIAEDTIISTVTSIMSKSIKNVDLVIGYAETEGDMLKVSARLTNRISDFDLNEILRRASTKVGGRGGGHKYAAGAQIPRKMKGDFEENLLSYFE